MIMEDEAIGDNRCLSTNLLSCINNNNMKTNLELFHILIRNMKKNKKIKRECDNYLQ